MNCVITSWFLFSLNTCQKAVNFANELLEGEDVLSLSWMKKIEHVSYIKEIKKNAI
jgi:hypothetical protein